MPLNQVDLRSVNEASASNLVGQTPGNQPLSTERTLERKNVQEEAQRVDLARLEKDVETVNERLKQQPGYMRFEIHKGTQDIIVRLIDRETETVLREFPSEKYLDLVAKMLEVSGLQVDARR